MYPASRSGFSQTSVFLRRAGCRQHAESRGNAVMTRRVSAQSSRNGLICEPTNRTGFPNAVLDRGSGGSDVVRLLAVGVVLSTSLVIGTPRCAAAGQWGGSLDITSDYIVRGISRS